ncbi:hypothetical protein K474DRAFT_1481973 [Panus rudis PR-1116 ss-1]|nr:hypothetical protein K474DRAFT_1481973 [Panus rudis PR-1116 ss-1]
MAQCPPEILGEIFLQNAQLYEEEEDYQDNWTPSTGPYQWLPGTTHVSRYWRQVALTTPLLWARIVVHSHPELVMEVLRRSKESPLDVVAFLDSRHNFARINSFIHILNSFLPRFRTLDLRTRAFKLTGDWITTTSPAPLLREVALTGLLHGQSNEQFSKALFNRDMPNLRTICIWNQIFVWDPSVFLPTLTHVILVSHGAGEYPKPMTGTAPEKRPTWDEFCEALDNMPNLSYLRLRNVFPQGEPREEHHRYLPKLEHLWISGGAVNCEYFVKAITFPQSTQVEASVQLILEDRDMHTTMDMLRELFQSVPEDSIRVFAGYELEGNEICIRLWTTDVPRSAYGSSDGDDRYPPRLELTVLSIDKKAVPMFYSLLKSLSQQLQNIHTLWLSMFTGEPQKYWLATFGGMRNIETLCVTHSAGEELPGILQWQMPHTTETKYIYPKLATLDFTEVDVADINKRLLQSMRGRDASQYASRTFLCGLRRAIVARERVGEAIQKLVFEKCYNLDEKDVESLRALGCEVEWDGIVQVREPPYVSYIKKKNERLR